MKGSSNMEDDSWVDPTDEKEDPDSPEARLAVKADERRGTKKQGKKPERSKPKAYAPDDGSADTNAYNSDSSEFNFEIVRHYPIVRTFSIKKPLKKSFMDSIADLLGSK